MKQLTAQELLEINGGGKFKWSVGLIIGAAATFIVGLIDGILRPLKCN